MVEKCLGMIELSNTLRILYENELKRNEEQMTHVTRINILTPQLHFRIYRCT
jgi:hypothetical protein